MLVKICNYNSSSELLICLSCDLNKIIRSLYVKTMVLNKAGSYICRGHSEDVFVSMYVELKGTMTHVKTSPHNVPNDILIRHNIHGSEVIRDFVQYPIAFSCGRRWWKKLAEEDHGRRWWKKIMIEGGGRCRFS